MKTVSERLVVVRKGLGLTQTQMSQFLNISIQCYSRYEKNLNEVKFKHLFKIYQHFPKVGRYLMGIDVLPWISANDIIGAKEEILKEIERKEKQKNED